MEIAPGIQYLELVDDGGRFVGNRIREYTGPFRIFAAIGVGRVGKSAMCNHKARVIANQLGLQDLPWPTRAFETSPSLVKPCTKGVNCICIPLGLDAATGRNKGTIIIMDVEGMDQANSGRLGPSVALATQLADVLFFATSSLDDRLISSLAHMIAQGMAVVGEGAIHWPRLCITFMGRSSEPEPIDMFAFFETRRGDPLIIDCVRFIQRTFPDLEATVLPNCPGVSEQCLLRRCSCGLADHVGSLPGISMLDDIDDQHSPSSFPSTGEELALRCEEILGRAVVTAEACLSPAAAFLLLQTKDKIAQIKRSILETFGSQVHDRIDPSGTIREVELRQLHQQIKELALNTFDQQTCDFLDVASSAVAFERSALEAEMEDQLRRDLMKNKQHCQHLVEWWGPAFHDRTEERNVQCPIPHHRCSRRAFHPKTMKKAASKLFRRNRNNPGPNIGAGDAAFAAATAVTGVAALGLEVAIDAGLATAVVTEGAAATTAAGAAASTTFSAAATTSASVAASTAASTAASAVAEGVTATASTSTATSLSAGAGVGGATVLAGVLGAFAAGGLAVGVGTALVNGAWSCGSNRDDVCNDVHHHSEMVCKACLLDPESTAACLKRCLECGHVKSV